MIRYVTYICDGLRWLRKTDGGCLVVKPAAPEHGKDTFSGVVYYVAWLLASKSAAEDYHNNL